MPLTKALLSQAVGWLLIGAILMLGSFPGQSLLGLALLQGVLAAGTAMLLKVEPWWPPIHLGFAPALVLGSHLAIDPLWFLAAFLLLLLVYWSSFRTRVPLYLSNHTTAVAVEDLARSQAAARILDLGCGTGSLMRHLAMRLPACQVTGIETAPLPWLIAHLSTRGLPNCRALRDDFWRHSLTGFDFVYAFLSPAPMERLWEKARTEMAPGALLVSNSFPVPGISPAEVIVLEDARETHLYLYRPAGE